MTIKFHDDLADLDRSYTPDFKVDYQNGEGHLLSVIIETKRMQDYRRTTGYMGPCYQAAHLLAEQQGMRFEYVSDEWLQSVGIANFEFIYQARKGALPARERSELVKELLNQSGLTMGTAIFLLNAKGIADPNVATATLMALVSDGYIGFAMPETLSLETRLYAEPIENPFAASIFPSAPWRKSEV